MRMKTSLIGAATLGLLIGFVASRWIGDGQRAFAQSRPARPSPTKALTDRDIYFPGTEDLRPDEMRITALGTGIPAA